MKERNEGRGSVQRTHKLQPSSINCRFQNHLLFEQVISPYRRRQRGVTIAPIMIIDSNPPPLLYRSFHHSIYIYMETKVFSIQRKQRSIPGAESNECFTYIISTFITRSTEIKRFFSSSWKNLFFFFFNRPPCCRARREERSLSILIPISSASGWLNLQLKPRAI